MLIKYDFLKKKLALDYYAILVLTKGHDFVAKEQKFNLSTFED